MATLPKGNYLAYQALQPVELKVGDFISKSIDVYIQQGKAAEAAKLKRLADEKKTVGDIYKDLKADYTQTIYPIQQSFNEVATDVINNISYGKRLFSDPNVSLQDARKQMAIAEAKANNYNSISKLIGSKEFIDAFNNKLKNRNTAATYDVSLQALDALGRGQARIASDPLTGTLQIGFPNSYDNKDAKVEWKDFNEVAYAIMNDFEPDRTKEYNTVVTEEAKTSFRAEKLNTTGNVTTERNVFLPEKAKQSFEINFGGFDVNSKNPLLKHLAFQVLGKPSVDNQEEYNKVEQNYIDTIKNSIPEKNEYIVEKSAQELENQRLEGLLKRKSLNTPTSSAATPQSKVNIIAPDISRGINNEITQIDKKGSGRNVQNATLINLNEKEYVAGYKVKNSNGKGFHTEYAILGRDEQGRFNYNEITKRGDVNIRLAGYGIDPLAVEKIILSGPEAKQGKWGSVSSKNLRAFNQASVPRDNNSSNTQSNSNQNQRTLNQPLRTSNKK